MPKCEHCGSMIAGAQIMYRAANTGYRRSNSIRLCGRCVDQHDKTEAGKKLRNIVLAIVGLGALLVFAGYVFVHR
jgi:hypothetical protein